MDTRLELIKFYDSHYSANLMQLVVYGKGSSANYFTLFFSSLLHILQFIFCLIFIVFAESLDNLQTLVENKFCGVRNTGRERFSFPGHPCSSEHLQVYIYHLLIMG